MTTPVPAAADILEHWRTRLNAQRAHPARVLGLRDLAAERHVAEREVAELVGRYLKRKITLAEMRTTFDKKTRSEWSSLGAAGPNGAMVLNQIAAQAPAFPLIEEAWRKLLPTPADAAAADAAIARMCAALDAARAVSDTPLKIPQNGRIPVLASILWGAQGGEWPPYFGSIVTALVRDRLYDGEGYGTFRAVFLGLRNQLNATSIELEDIASQKGQAAPIAEAAEAPSATRRVWLIAPGKNAVYWDQWRADGVMTIGWDEVGDLSKFPSQVAVRDKLREVRGSSPDPTNAARACWQFAHDIRPGDIVYAKRGIGTIVGRGEVTSDYRYQTKKGDPHVRSVRWDAQGAWETSSSLAMKTLTEIGKSPQLVRELSDLVSAVAGPVVADDDAIGAAPNETYTLEHASAELFMPRDQLEELLDLWRYKKNLILQGPPGVGKTFVASRLAHLLIGSTDEEQICRVQFHPSYAYEDFVQGLRPTTSGGFERHDGPLLRFCKQALQDPESEYVLVIDEINRGNVSKILGELLSLIEADKRSPEYAMTLAYARPDEPRFHVPPNLFVIGMMNTADRALSLVDYALRRRFVFVELAPAFGRSELRDWWIKLGIDGTLRGRIESRLGELNETIAKDASLGPGYAVGHSYFCQDRDVYDDAWFERILRYEIEPLLREYWFDAPAKVLAATTALRGG